MNEKHDPMTIDQVLEAMKAAGIRHPGFGYSVEAQKIKLIKAAKKRQKRSNQK